MDGAKSQRKQPPQQQQQELLPNGVLPTTTTTSTAVVAAAAAAATNDDVDKADGDEVGSHAHQGGAVSVVTKSRKRLNKKSSAGSADDDDGPFAGDDVPDYLLASSDVFQFDDQQQQQDDRRRDGRYQTRDDQQSQTTGDVVQASLVDEERIRKLVQQELIDSAVQVLDADDEKDDLNSENMQRQRFSRRRRVRILSFIVVLVVIVVIVVIVVVTVKSKNPSSQPQLTAPSFNPATAPFVTPVAPPQYLPTDLSNNSELTEIFQVLEAGENHTLMTRYIKYTDLVDYLSSSSTGTVFAPTDASWQNFANTALSYSFYVNLTTNPHFWFEHLKFLLQYHIVNQVYNVPDLFGGFSVSTSTPDRLHLELDVSEQRVGDNAATLVTVNIRGIGGYIHVPDKVLIPTQLNETILQRIMASPNFKVNVLADIIRSTPDDKDFAFVSTLEGVGVRGMTLLAFSDDTAFGFINTTTTTTSPLLQENQTRLNGTITTRQFLGYQLIPTNLYNLQSSSVVTTYGGYSMWVVTTTSANSSPNTYCNGALISDTEYVQNGVLALVDNVLLPPNMADMLRITTDVSNNYTFTTFLNISSQPTLEVGRLLTDETQQQLTLLAPLDHAFVGNSSEAAMLDRLWKNNWRLHLQNVVLHHFTSQVVQNTTGTYNVLMLSGFNTTIAVSSVGDITEVNNVTTELVRNGPLRTTNGVIHFLNGLLLPNWAYETIDQVLSKQPDLTILVSLIQSNSSFLNLLKSTGPLTLLAPSNEALAAVNISALVVGSSLDTILLGHVFNGVLYSSYFGLNATKVESVNNQTWQTQIIGDGIYVSSARITIPNVLAVNGVIHVIDQLLEMR